MRPSSSPSSRRQSRGFRQRRFAQLSCENDSQTAEAAPRESSSGALAEEFSHPEWLVKRWLAEFGADGSEIADARK
jgi:16S rRNA C967 or C1407 C5-methylase (RsmB/RsmF family)